MSASSWSCTGEWVVILCFRRLRLGYSSADIQLVRLMSRDGSSREEASARLNSQMAISSKIEYAQLVIDNSGTRAELASQVDGFVHKVEQSVSTPRWLLCWLIPPLGLLCAGWTVLGRLL